MTTPKTDTKEIARQARLLLAAAKALRQLTKEVTAPELLVASGKYDAECEWVKWTNHALDDMVKAALTCEGIDIAVFPQKDTQQP